MQGLAGGRPAAQNMEDQERSYKRLRGEAETNVCKDAWYKRAKKGRIHQWGCRRCHAGKPRVQLWVFKIECCALLREK